MGDKNKHIFYPFDSDTSDADSYGSEIYGISPEIDSFRKERLEYTTEQTIKEFKTIESALSSALSNRRTGLPNRRRLFNTTAIFNIKTELKNTVTRLVGRLVGPGFILDGILSISVLPPVVVLPLAVLAFLLFFRDSIGDKIDAIFCK